jgi:hypothetical protein
MSRARISLAALALALAALPGPARAQCRTTATTGAATYTQVSGLPVTGTALANTSALDGTAFQVSNVGGVLIQPSVRRLFSTWIENGSGSGPIYYGITFANPTNAAITITQVVFTSSGDLWSATGFTMISPATNWTRTANRTVTWALAAGLSVPANSAQSFIFYAQDFTTSARATYTINVAVTATGGPYNAAPFTIDMPGSVLPYGADTTVGFDSALAATYVPIGVFNAAGGANTVVTMPIRVRETSSSGATQNGISSGLTLTVTIPPGWSNVSFSTAAAPWSLATAVYTQPTLFASGSAKITTSASIARGASTAVNSLALRATTPVNTFTNSVFPFDMSLAGFALDGVGPIASINESIVKVTTGVTAGPINAEFKSSPLATPVRQIDFVAYVNVTGGTGSDSLNVDVYNNSSASWTTISTITPTAAFAPVTRSFTSDFEPYLDGSSQMRVRVVETGTTTRILGVDFLSWTVTTGYTVNNFTGSDLNAGNAARPFKSITKAAGVVATQGSVYVDVGSSQTGTPYGANVTLPALAAGVAGCRTLVQGVASSGLLPLVVGTDPTSDGGFTVLGSHAQVDGFQVQNVQVGLGADIGVSDAVLSNNWVTVAPNGYGIILNANSASQVVGNRIDGSSVFFGIWDYAGAADLMDGNRVAGFGAAGIRVDGANGVKLQRNIVRASYVGLHVANSTAPITLYNNTSDANTFLALYVEGATGAVTSRNNVLTNSPFGWGWDGKGTVSSDYEDLFGNGNNTNYHGAVTAGANSISANPAFVQTANPALATYYALGGGSPCRDTGVNVGLPFLGAGPDRGATEQ